MKSGIKTLLPIYQKEFPHLSPVEMLRKILENHPGKVAFSTSFGAEDQVITHLLSLVGLPVRIFTLDTGRLFQETYDLLDITIKKYRIPIDVCFPDAGRVEEIVNLKGINLFYDSVENRKLCCHIRKIEPLRKALTNMDIWITGLRKDQSVTRTDLGVLEWDGDLKLIKVNPLIGWTHEEVWQYIRAYQVPYSPLHDKGYPSIGCMPCTRAILPGEDIRAGRWWWEHPELKECGLHVNKENFQDHD